MLGKLWVKFCPMFRECSDDNFHKNPTLIIPPYPILNLLCELFICCAVTCRQLPTFHFVLSLCPSRTMSSSVPFIHLQGQPARELGVVVSLGTGNPSQEHTKLAKRYNLVAKVKKWLNVLTDQVRVFA